MKNIKKSAVGVAALLVIAAGAVQPAMAQDAKNMRMIERITVDPSKGMEWNEGWMGLNEMAEEGDYPYTEIVLTHRNNRWILTPIANFAELDDVMTTRDNFAKKHGDKFEDVFAKMQGAETDSHTFISRFDPELSYTPEGDALESYSQIETYWYRPGSGGEMSSIISNFKSIAKESGSPNGFDVYWNGLGQNGSSVTIVSTGENALDLA